MAKLQKHKLKLQIIKLQMELGRAGMVKEGIGQTGGDVFFDPQSNISYEVIYL